LFLTLPLISFCAASATVEERRLSAA
jgi:hypothetical protein